MSRPRSTVFLTLIALLACACGGAAPASAAQPTSGISGRVTVFAASSLTEAFNTLGAEFTKVNPQVTVTPSYGGSAVLVTQLSQGAVGDIFASADEANMRKLVDATLSDGTPAIFARNRLQIVVRAGNPRRIAQLSDLARPDLIVVLGATAVPVGAYAQQAFDNAGVKVTAKSLETDARAVLSKVSLGEADAGIVYATDVKVGGAKVEGVEIPGRYNVDAKYPISLVRGGTNPRAASAFIEFIGSAKGRDVLTSFGFVLP